MPVHNLVVVYVLHLYADLDLHLFADLDHCLHSLLLLLLRLLSLQMPVPVRHILLVVDEVVIVDHVQSDSLVEMD
jgi:hypothetical protein